MQESWSLFMWQTATAHWGCERTVYRSRLATAGPTTPLHHQIVLDRTYKKTPSPSTAIHPTSPSVILNWVCSWNNKVTICSAPLTSDQVNFKSQVIDRWMSEACTAQRLKYLRWFWRRRGGGEDVFLNIHRRNKLQPFHFDLFSKLSFVKISFFYPSKSRIDSSDVSISFRPALKQGACLQISSKVFVQKQFSCI